MAALLARIVLYCTNIRTGSTVSATPAFCPTRMILQTLQIPQLLHTSPTFTDLLSFESATAQLVTTVQNSTLHGRTVLSGELEDLIQRIKDTDICLGQYLTQANATVTMYVSRHDRRSIPNS